MELKKGVKVVDEGVEKVRLNWGVRLLPWLILTDRHHIIRAQGFNLGELDGEIKAITEKLYELGTQREVRNQR